MINHEYRAITPIVYEVTKLIATQTFILEITEVTSALEGVLVYDIIKSRNEIL
jgi:hypothetical protein